ncbi:hypothetical protein GCM10023168_26230 [Fodinibacter luteus]|uniref:Integral membrane protein n=1 Tax=Fodinibacter luteus TaxID=552064 RepID=A0ABP8KK83_9MICO
MLLALGVTLVLRGWQILATAYAASWQTATGQATPNGAPNEYFVFSPSGPSPGLGPVLGNWDGEWYERIATLGYPDATQKLSANDAWASAFPPGFPLMARIVMEASGLPFVWASLLLNTVLTLLATALLYRLLRSRDVGPRPASWASIGISLLPSSPVLMAAYSEALALVFLLAALRWLTDRRYIFATIAVVGLAFTRPVAVAFVPVVLAHAAIQWRQEPRGPSWRTSGGVVALLMCAALSPWMWPWTAAAVYGVPEAADLDGSARVGHTAKGVGGYFVFAWEAGGPLVFVLLTLLLALLVGVPAALSRRMGWPPELAVWGASYLVLVLVVTPVTPGFIRYLVLAAPLLVAIFAAPMTRITPLRVGVLAVLVAISLWSQWLWIRYLLVLDPAPHLIPWPP